MSIKIPATLTDEQAVEFTVLYKKHFNEELSRQNAYNKGLYLLQYMATILNLSGAYFANKIKK